MAYQAVEEIQNRCEKEGIPFWKAVQLEDCEENGITEEESWQQMALMWTRMKESVDAYDPSEKSRSGLVGKEGGLMDEYLQNEKPLCGDFVSKVIANALKMGCNNACMKRIVAAPTAGACGVMPAVLVTYFREFLIEEDRMMNAIRWLLSQDVDVITSSCGYTIFDDYDGYTVSMLDGHSSRISQFVDSVLQVNSNLIFIQSMGNEGDEPWRYSNFPADVREVISVGAIESDSTTRAGYSSIGYGGVDFIKPDVCAYAQPPRRGTSYTAPVIAGLCASLLEYKRMSRNELINLLHTSGLNSSAPNYEIGYGIPQTSRMLLLFK